MTRLVVKFLVSAIAGAAIMFGFTPVATAHAPQCTSLPEEIAALKARAKATTDPQKAQVLKHQVKSLSDELAFFKC